ncbi:MAG: hypothetical protein Kow0092_11570 [Deferrisomatales bacterium]
MTPTVEIHRSTLARALATADRVARWGTADPPWGWLLWGAHGLALRAIEPRGELLCRIAPTRLEGVASLRLDLGLLRQALPPGETAVLRLVSEGRLEVAHPGGRAWVPALPESDPPELEGGGDPPEESQATAGQALAAAVERLHHCLAPRGDFRTSLQGFRLAPADGGLSLWATDGHRAGRARTWSRVEGLDDPITVDGEGLREALGSGELRRVRVCAGRLEVEAADGGVLSLWRLVALAEAYPDLSRVWPEDPLEITVEGPALLEAAQYLAALSRRADGAAVRCELEGERLRLTLAPGPDVLAELCVPADAPAQEPAPRWAWDPRYFLEAVRAAQPGPVGLGYRSAAEPVAVSGPEHQEIVMPLRLD